MVDSSVWIEFLRGRPVWEVEALIGFVRADADIVVGDIVLCEVLSGASDERVAAQLEQRLRRFAIVAMCGEAIAVEAAANYRALRTLGITIRKTIDLLIGTYCIRNRLPLLHRDRDFDAMERHLGLRVLHA